MIEGKKPETVPEETRSGSHRETLTEIFAAFDKAGVPEGLLSPSDRGQEPSQERPDLFLDDANAKGISLGAASSELLRRAEQSPELPSSMLRLNHLGLTVKAKTSQAGTIQNNIALLSLLDLGALDRAVPRLPALGYMHAKAGGPHRASR